MRISFSRALERDSNDWYALLELGDLDALEGNRQASVVRLREAHRLNPGDPLILTVLRRAERGGGVPLRSIDRQLLARVCGRLGRTQQTRYCGVESASWPAGGG